MGPGPLIAIDVLLLYLLLGPLVLFGIYVFFDGLGTQTVSHIQKSKPETSPALWTDREVRSFLEKSSL